MSDLDNKLINILSNDALTLSGKISQIKQAFHEAGYLVLVDLPEGIYNFDGKRFTQIASGNHMTGKEFYDRFIEEYSKVHLVDPEKRLTIGDLEDVFGQIINAAKVAAGINEPNQETS